MNCKTKTTKEILADIVSLTALSEDLGLDQFHICAHNILMSYSDCLEKHNTNTNFGTENSYRGSETTRASPILAS